MSVFVATGDSGATACSPTGLVGSNDVFQVYVNGVASTPFNTAVGGTEFDETANGGRASTYWNTTNGSDLSSAVGYIPEKVWNDTETTGVIEVLGTGGGVSNIYPTPSWQTLNVTGLSVLGRYSLPGQPGVAPRGLPDVSLDASPVQDPYLFCFTDPLNSPNPDCQLENGTFGPNTFQHGGGGTSFSAPAFAGLMAIINQKVWSDHPSSQDGRQGLANYVLYPLATTEDFSSCNSSNRTNPSTPAPVSCVFNDVTAGDNSVPDVTGYSAGVGYDLASGLGSVDAANLVSAWDTATAAFHGSDTTLASTPSGSISINHGQSVTFDVAVQKMAGDNSTRAPAGAISLIAQGGTLSGTASVASAALAGSSSPSSTGNFSVENLPGGSYNLMANFPGDGYFASSVSNTIAVTVAPEASTTTLLGPRPLPYGSDIMLLSANVTGKSGHGTPSGQLTLTDSGNAFATINLNNQGIAEFLNCPFAGGIVVPSPSTVPCFLPGTHVITATYSGDGSFLPSPSPAAASQTVTVIIEKGFPPLYVGGSTSDPNTLINDTFTLTAVLQGVSGAAVPPTGTVQFFDGTTLLGQAPIATVQSFQQASVSTKFSQGVHQISASYSGDTLYAAQSASNEVDNGVPIGWATTSTTQTVNPAQSATYNLTLSTATGFTGQVPLSCLPGNDPLIPTNEPPGVQCSVNPTSVSFTSSATSFPVTVTMTTSATAKAMPAPFSVLALAFAGVFAVGLRKKTSRRPLLLLSVALVAATGMTSCGSGSSSQHGQPPAKATYTVWAEYPASNGNTVYSGVTLTTNINQ